MPHKNQIALPSFFSIGDDKIAELPGLLASYRLNHRSVLLLGDHKTFACGGDRLAAYLRRDKKKIIKKIVTNSDEKNVKKIADVISQTKPDIVIGVGGGKVLDVGKLAAGKRKRKFISVPTTLSNDGIASPIAVIKNNKKIPISHITHAPFGVVVDIRVVKRAPVRHIRAGVGDIISNLSAVFDARLARKRKKEKIDETALSLAESGAVGLLNSSHKKVKDRDFLILLAQGLIKSGCAMCIIGSSRPASGSEHKISHSLDHLYPSRKTLHGEQVGIAALFTMALQKNTYLTPVKKMYKRISFPHKLAHLSLTPEQFITVIHKAHRFRPHRYTILEDKKITPSVIKQAMHAVGLV